MTLINLFARLAIQPYIGAPSAEIPAEIASTRMSMPTANRYGKFVLARSSYNTFAAVPYGGTAGYRGSAARLSKGLAGGQRDSGLGCNHGYGNDCKYEFHNLPRADDLRHSQNNFDC
jgi:hypothetical protein